MLYLQRDQYRCHHIVSVLDNGGDGFLGSILYKLILSHCTNYKVYIHTYEHMILFTKGILNQLNKYDPVVYIIYAATDGKET